MTVPQFLAWAQGLHAEAVKEHRSYKIVPAPAGPPPSAPKSPAQPASPQPQQTNSKPN